MRPKTLDAVEMKHSGAARVQKRLAGKSRAEELDFWKKQEAQLRAQQAAAIARASKAS